MTKQTLLAVLSVGAVGLLLFGKYKLATASLTLPILLLAGIVFAISTPAVASGTSEIAAGETYGKAGTVR
jgi:hypothetical protein